MKAKFFLVLVAIVVALSGCDSLFQIEEYETNNIEDYGNITGTYQDDNVEAYIFSFFPPEISDKFKDPQYHYKANKGAAYAYECWLEFVVEDAATFTALTEHYVNSPRTDVFAYDNSFMDYTVNNYLSFQDDFLDGEENTSHNIFDGKIGKVLFRQKDRRIIFLAMGAYDSGTTIEEFDYFFTRFSIDPLDFEQNAFSSPGEEQEYWGNQKARSVIPFLLS